MRVELFRLESTQKSTLGVLRVDGVLFCVTLENPWANNQRNISCIPCGQYLAKRVQSPTFGNTFEASGVPGRSAILFHVGNTADDTRGCILPGTYTAGIPGNRLVRQSRKAFDAFIHATRHVDEFDLFICEI